MPQYCSHTQIYLIIITLLTILYYFDKKINIYRPHIQHPKQHIRKFFPNKYHFLSKIVIIIVHITESHKRQQHINHSKEPQMTNKSLQSDILTFIATYGESALQDAMQQYIDNQQIYLYKTKSQTTKIKISDIFYLQSQQHNITIHTLHGTYRKYGTLSQELTTLYPYGFVKCTQSCIVSLSKIRTIHNNDITLIDDTVLHVSRSYAPKVLTAFNGKNYSCNSSDSNISVKK